MAVSEKEIKRRIEAVREKMKLEDLQVLIVFSQVQTGYAGACRYLSNYHLTTRKEYILLPLEGDPVLFVPTLGQQHWAAASSWIKDVRNCGEAEGMIREIAKVLKSTNMEKATIGIVGLTTNLPQHDFSLLIHALPHATYKDGTELFNSVRMKKSDEEVEMIRETTDIADQTYDRLLEILRPGTDERYIMAEVNTLLAGKGVEDVLILTAKGPTFPGYINHPGPYVFRSGDHYVWSVEISGPSGYWSQIVRPVFLEKTTARHQEMFDVAKAASEAAVSRLIPGRRIGELVAVVSDTVRKAGFRTGLWCGHGMGMDVGEAPPLFLESNLELQQGMVITIHPHVMTLDGKEGMFLGDTYVVRKDGAENLSRTRSELKRVG